MIPQERTTLQTILDLTAIHFPGLKNITLCWWCGTPSDQLQTVSETQPEKLCPGCWYCYTHQAPRFEPPDA